MTKTLYVIQGSTGEYSDRREWNVAVVDSEEAAKSYVLALQKQYQEMPQAWLEDRWDFEDQMKEHMTLDPQFAIDYTGTNWWYAEVACYDEEELEKLLDGANL